MITQKEINSLLEAAVAKTITASQAITQLVAGGMEDDQARETVFLAIGGSDLVVTDEAGVDRYDPSGRSVADVDADMVG